MAAPTETQFASNTTAGGAAISVTVSSTPAGATIVAAAVKNDTTGAINWSVSDDQSNTYTLRETVDGSGRACQIWDCINATAGVTSVTLTIDSGTPLWLAVVWVLSPSGGGTIEYDVDDENVDTTNSTSQQCAATGITTAADVAVLGVFALNGASGGGTAGSGYTERIDATSRYVQTQLTNTALSGDVGPFTTSNNRQGVGILASWKNVAAGGVTLAGRISLLGVGR